MTVGLLTKGPPTSPAWVLYLRIAIIFFSVLVLALSGWAVHILTPRTYATNAGVGSSGSGGSTCATYQGRTYCIRRRAVVDYDTAAPTTAPALSIFATVFSLLVHSVVLAVEKFAARSYLRICVFVSYILVAIFVLCGWAYMAARAAVYVPIAQEYRNSIQQSRDAAARGGYKVDLPNADSSPTVQAANSTAIAGSLGAVLWILIIVNTVMFTLACLRSEGEPMSSAGGTNAELGQVHTKQAESSVMPVPVPVATPPVYNQQQAAYGPPPQQYQQGYVTPQPQQVQQIYA